jgi:hypothetical protein
MSNEIDFQSDRKLYQRLMRRCSFGEKLRLLDSGGDYFLYQHRLYRLARKYGLLPPVPKPPELP